MKRISYLLFAVVLLAVSACKKDNGNTPAPQPQGGGEVYFTAEASGESAYRSFAFELGKDGPELKMKESPVKSVIIISDGNNHYYFDLTWNKTQGKNHLYVKGTEVLKELTGKQVSITEGKDWYIMGCLGGNYSNYQVHYQPNKTLQVITEGESIEKDLPMYFSWTKLSITTKDGKTLLKVAEGKSIDFRPLGMLMRLQLNNKNSYTTKVKSILFQSNVLSTGKGYIDLSSYGLPPIPPTGLKSDLSWKENSEKDTPYTFVGEDGTTILEPTIEAGKTFGKNFLIWAMPQENDNPMTHLLANAVRMENGQEMTYPKMKTLYIWGSTNQPKEGTRRILKAQILRPKMALEYFAPNYVGTSSISSSPLSTTHDYTGAGLYDYGTISATDFLLGTVYMVPEVVDAMGLFIPTPNGEDFKKLDNDPNEVEETIRINGVSNRYRDLYQTVSENVIYALRLDGVGTDRAQYSAWKYTLLPPVYSGSEDKAAHVKIECVYLGVNYKGQFPNIVGEDFWNLHQSDIVSRTYYAAPVKNPEGVEPAIQHFMPCTWVKGSFRNLEHLLWGFGIREKRGIIISNSAKMENIAVVDWKEYEKGITKYIDGKTVVIPIEKPNTPWPSNNR